MELRKPCNLIFSASILSLMLSSDFLWTPVASASSLYPHGYAFQYLFQNNTGGYFSSTNVQDDLSSNYSSSYTNTFVTKEMWLNFTSKQDQWIEVGDVDGNVNNKYWAGHYTAYQSASEYREFTVGSFYPTGTHNFEVQYLGSNSWGVYVDYSNVMTFTFPYSSASVLKFGIETNDSGNSFTSGTYDSAAEYLDTTSGSWKYLTSASNGDNNTLGWKSSFSYANGNNKIVFTHN